VGEPAPIGEPQRSTVWRRGWGNYFRTGNAADKFRQVDDYVVKRLYSLMIKKRGRNQRYEQLLAWTEQWFNGYGL
jgi:RNA-directed DNA polymerase